MPVIDLPEEYRKLFKRSGAIGGKHSWRKENRAWRLLQLAKARKAKLKKNAKKD